MRGFWRICKRALYLVFGLLAFGIGLTLIGWIFYNLLQGDWNPSFEAALPKEPLLRALRVLIGLSMAFLWGTVGLYWMAKSGLFFRRLEYWKKK